MKVEVLKSKIHKAVVTQADLNYEGSLGIDQDIMDKVGLLPYEKILVSNLNNGQRLETYVIPSERGSRSFLLNGSAARLGGVGDRIIIMNFAYFDVEDIKKGHKPTVAVLNEVNEIELLK